MRQVTSEEERRKREGSFPLGAKLVGEKEKKRKRRRKKERSGEGKIGEKRGRNGKRGKKEDFQAFRRSKLDGPRIKVGPRNESYAWVLKSLGLIKLQEVGVLSYFGYSWFKSHLMA